MNQVVKKALGDWRLPLIFAIPILLVAGVLYLALQPIAGTTAAGRNSGDTVTMISTPVPTFVPTPYPTVVPVIAPVYPTTIACTNPATVTAFHATTTMEGGNVVIRVRDQNGRLVSCAWAVPKGGNHAVGGMTDTTGTVVYPLASLPSDDYFFGLIEMKGTAATTAYSFSR